MLPFQDSLSQRQEPPWMQKHQVTQQGSWVTEPDRRLQGPAHLATEQKGQKNPTTGPCAQPNCEEGQTDGCVCGGQVTQQQTLKAPAKNGAGQQSQSWSGRRAESPTGTAKQPPHHISVGCSDRPCKRHTRCKV